MFIQKEDLSTLGMAACNRDPKYQCLKQHGGLLLSLSHSLFPLEVSILRPVSIKLPETQASILLLYHPLGMALVQTEIPPHEWVDILASKTKVEER